MIHSRFANLNEDMSTYLASSDEVSELAIALRTQGKETPEQSQLRTQLVAYILRQVGELNPLLCTAMAAYLLSIQEKEVLCHLVRAAGITIQDKLLKKVGWKNALIERLLFRIGKPGIHAYIQSVVSSGSERLISRLIGQYGSLQGFLEHIGDEDRFEYAIQHKASGTYNVKQVRYVQSVNRVALYEACLITKRVIESQHMIHRFNEMDWAVYETEVLNGYYFVKGSSEVLEGKKQASTTYLDALRHAKEYEERYEYEKMQSDHLSEQLERVNRSAEEQLAEALQLIEQLQLENEILKEELSSTSSLLEQFQSKNLTKPFAGFRILIVGHPDQKEMYRQEIQKLGGDYEFFPAVIDNMNIRLMDGPINRADIIFYITSYTQHMMHEYLRNKVSSERLVFLTCRGRSSFVREVNSYVEQGVYLLSK